MMLPQVCRSIWIVSSYHWRCYEWTMWVISGLEGKQDVCHHLVIFDSSKNVHFMCLDVLQGWYSLLWSRLPCHVWHPVWNLQEIHYRESTWGLCESLLVRLQRWNTFNNIKDKIVLKMDAFYFLYTHSLLYPSSYRKELFFAQYSILI